MRIRSVGPNEGYMTQENAQSILDFWFSLTLEEQMSGSDPALDATVRQRFEGLVQMASQGGCEDWLGDSESALALCILLDQFPRQIYRKQAAAFAADELVLGYARVAIARGYHHGLDPMRAMFFFLPFQHAEDLGAQELARGLFAESFGVEHMAYEYTVKHLEIIRRFGRFPHRNMALGRDSTPEERVYFQEGLTDFERTQMEE